MADIYLREPDFNPRLYITDPRIIRVHLNRFRSDYLQDYTFVIYDTSEALGDDGLQRWHGVLTSEAATPDDLQNRLRDELGIQRVHAGGRMGVQDVEFTLTNVPRPTLLEYVVRAFVPSQDFSYQLARFAKARIRLGSEVVYESVIGLARDFGYRLG